MSVAFVYMSAPDLALTQISVEVVTIILLLLALNFLPKNTPVESSARTSSARRVIAILGGVAVRWPRAGRADVATSRRTASRPSIWPIPIPGGGGTNVVNVILVDFRGFDTFGEIIVLGIAALVIFA